MTPSLMKKVGGPTQHQYDSLLQEIENHPIASHAPQHLQQMGLESSLDIFSDHEMGFNAGFPEIFIKNNHIKTSIHISKTLAPALIAAHLHFGNNLPRDLIYKLRNKTQTLDTIFELNCLSILQLSHEVIYEPRLSNGKVPDLMLPRNKQNDIYIECKSQSRYESEYQRTLEKFTYLSIEAIESSNARKLAWEEGYRTEIRINLTPTLNDVTTLRELINKKTIDDLLVGISIGNSINVIAVPRDTPYLSEPSNRVCQIVLTTEPTKLSRENTHIVAYSWPSIDLKRIRSQKNLLTQARRKLSGIPKNTLGMICMQIDGMKKFIPDVHAALTRPEFINTPMIWLNPSHESELICRNDSIWLRDAIFKPLQEELSKSN